MKKIFFSILILISIFILTPSPSFAQVNIISNLKHAEYAVAENLNQTIVFAGHPDNPQQIIDVCNQAEVCVIRGHAHWLYGNEMLNKPVSAAQTWSNALAKIAAGTSGQVYFEPWNEPMRLDVECGGLDTITCANRIKTFINNLNTHGITLTSPAIDPYHPNSTAMISALGNIPYSVISMHIYSPELARNYRGRLSQLGVRGSSSFPVILTETGALDSNGDDIPDEGGTPVYREKILCNMYCTEINGQTTVDFWKSQGINYALFSLGPDGISWNLWEAECVIDALKGDCHCETCEEEGTKKAIAKEMYERTGKEQPSLEDPDLRVGRNWPSGGTTMETHNALWDILMWLMKIVLGEVRVLFRILPGQGLFQSSAITKLIEIVEVLENLFPSIEFIGNISENLGSQQLVPSDRGGRFPGEDYYVEKTLTTNKLELPGTTAQICLPDRDINYTLKYFPNQQPDEFVIELLNLTSIHEQVANSLQVYNKMRHWSTGSAYSDYLEYIDMTTKEGEKKMAFRGFTENLIAGYMSKRLPGKEMVMEGENWANLRLRDLLASGDPADEKSPVFDPEDIEKGIGIADKPILRVCEDGPITEDDYTLLLDDNRVNRKEAEDCQQPREIKISELCCNREHIEYLGLDYDEVCKYVSGWACNGDEPVDSWLLYGNKYSLGKFSSDSGISEADWPIYLEQCFVAKEEKCDDDESYNGLFADLTDQQRAKIFPPSTWDDTNPRNTYLTRAKGECLSCQIVKLFLPEGLGALDACREMTSTFLPGSMYEEMIDKDFPQKKNFSCDVGELPYTDAEETHKDNADYENFQRTWDEERWHGFITELLVDNNCEPGFDEEGNPTRCSVNKKVKSYMHLYVPHYEKLQLCTDLYYGLLSGKNSEDLEKELEELNGNKLKAKDLLERTKVNPIVGEKGGAISAGMVTGSTAVEIKADVDQGKDIYLPGGGTEAGVNASQKIYIPGGMQEAWFPGAGYQSVSETDGRYQDPSFFSNWNKGPTDLIDGGQGLSLTDTISELRIIAQQKGIPEELLLAKFWIEGGYFWDGGDLWCPASEPNCHGSDTAMYWIGLRHYLPNGEVVESYSGAHGLAQIYVPVHPDYDVKRAEADWRYNAEYGADYLVKMYNLEGNWADAVRRYHSPSEAEAGLNLVKHFLENPPINPETGQPAWNSVNTDFL